MIKRRNLQFTFHHSLRINHKSFQIKTTGLMRSGIYINLNASVRKTQDFD
jgi:hypothetical protein